MLETYRSGEPGRRLRRLLPMASLLLALTAAPADQAGATSKVSHFVLGNGMQVVVVPDHRVPIVTHQVWYKVGAAEDPPGLPGVAHFLEHLMFKGTERFPGNYFERFVVANGGASINAFTTQDHTVYPQSLPRKHLAALMELEADRMVNLQIREEHIAPELGVVLNERRGNENNPIYLLLERVNAARFPDHPYGRSVIGTDAQIKALSRASALALYRRFYAPNNAVLVVAGDVTESEVRALAEKTFGRVPAKKDLPQRIIQRAPDRKLPLRVELEHPRVTTPIVAYYYATPGVGAMPRADAHALELLSRIAGASIIGRLHRRLVLEERLAASVASSFSSSLRAGSLNFAADAAPGVSAAALEAALAREIATLTRDGVTQAEADDAKRGFQAARAYDQDNHRLRAGVYGAALVQGLSIADVDAVYDLVARATAADINRLAAKFVASSEPVVGVLRPPVVSRAAAPSSTATR